MVEGLFYVAFGRGATERTEIAPGVLAGIPKGVVHREGNAGAEPTFGIAVRVGQGPVTLNLDGPDEEAATSGRVSKDCLEAVNVSIRPAVAADIEAMQAIEVDAGECFRAIGLHVVADDPPPEATALQRFIASDRAWIAEGRPDGADGAAVAVGYALASVLDGEGHLDQVSVLGRAAGRGIGSALVQVVLAWARAAGHQTVTLTTYRDVPWNGPWYARLGFVELADLELGPGLRAILERERALGLVPPERVAMRRTIGPL